MYLYLSLSIFFIVDYVTGTMSQLKFSWAKSQLNIKLKEL